MLKSIVVSKVNVLRSPYRRGEVIRHLNYLLEHSSQKSVTDIILKIIQPVRVIIYNNKAYAVENLDELDWIKSIDKTIAINAYMIEKTSNIEDVHLAIFYHYYFKHLSSLNNLDLYAIESNYIQEKEDYFLTQKQYSELLDCDRTVLYRHAKKIKELSKDERASHEIKSSEFNWSELTSRIPNPQ